jgi:hypothetical protein
MSESPDRAPSADEVASPVMGVVPPPEPVDYYAMARSHSGQGQGPPAPGGGTLFVGWLLILSGIAAMAWPALDEPTFRTAPSGAHNIGLCTTIFSRRRRRATIVGAV